METANTGTIKRLLAGCLAITLWALGAIPTQAEQVETLKAAFVLNFLKFTEYPQSTPALTAPAQPPPLVIAVIGNDPLANTMKTILDGKTVQGRKVEITLFQTAADWHRSNQPCHVLFLTPTEKAAWPSIHAALANRPVLTISQSPGFCSQGGLLNLLEQANRIRFEANPDAAAKQGLKFRSELLKLATVVTTKGDNE